MSAEPGVIQHQMIMPLFFINFSALAISVLVTLFHILSGTASEFFIVDLLADLIFLLAFMALLNGKITYALNTVFLIPVLLYVANLSDFVDHGPESESMSSVTWALTITLGYLSVFSKSALRIRGFFIASILFIAYHIYKAELLSQFFTLHQNFTANPLIITTSVFSLLMFVRIIFKRQIKEIGDDLAGIQRNIRELFSAIRYPAIHVKIEKAQPGEVSLMTVERINPAFESVFGTRYLEISGQDAGHVFKKAFFGSITPGSIFNSDVNRREVYLENLDKWYVIHVLKPDSNNFYAVFNDITSEKHLVSDLEESKLRYKVLLEAIPDMFFIIGKDGTYEDILIKDDDRAKVQESEIIGKTIFEIGFSKTMAEKIFDCIQTAISTYSKETIEYELSLPSIGRFIFEMRIARLNENSVISIARDITSRKMAEFNLIEAKEKVEELMRLKSVFLASLSQNIRTPINIILAFSKILCDNNKEGYPPEFLVKGISENSHLLLKMIDDTINLSKIETNTVDQKSGHTRINQLLRMLYSQFIEIIPAGKNVKLEIKAEVDSSDFGFFTDHNLLSEVLNKLIDNAIKFSTEGTVSFGYHLRPGNNLIEFFVEDQGLGILPEEQKHIFDRFFVGKSHRSDITCPGLGLPIAQHFVALLGGELNVETEPGRGSRFYFSLPLREGKGYLRIVS